MGTYIHTRVRTYVRPTPQYQQVACRAGTSPCLVFFLIKKGSEHEKFCCALASMVLVLVVQTSTYYNITLLQNFNNSSTYMNYNITLLQNFNNCARHARSQTTDIHTLRITSTTILARVLVVDLQNKNNSLRWPAPFLLLFLFCFAVYV